MQNPPATHKLLAAHLRDKTGGSASVFVYRDDQGHRPVPIGTFGSGKQRLLSTIGLFEQSLPVPPGAYELAAIGSPSWLPNSLASSVYWLRERRVDSWPLVCEDAVRHNTRSRYRHMAYIPSKYAFEVVPGVAVQWLLGIPISDKDIGLSYVELGERISASFPSWLT